MRNATATGPSSAVQGMVFDIQGFSLHDGPGIRTTVFLKGCPLHCFWCQNPEGLGAESELQFLRVHCLGCGTCLGVCPHGVHRLEDGEHRLQRAQCTRCGKCVEACPGQALSILGRAMSVAEVLAAAVADRPYFEASGGGVTLSGGEPLYQPEFSTALLAACKATGLHTAVDTSLAVPWPAVEGILPFTDLFLVDLKHADAGKHRQATGASNAPVLANLRRLGEYKVPVIVRVPVVPAINDTPSEIAAIARLAASVRNVRHLELLPYHRLGDAKREGLGLPVPAPLPPVTGQHLRQLAEAAAREGVTIKGTALQREAGAPVEPGGRDGTPGYRERLAALRQTKLRHTELKRRQGPRDVDDWGQIPLDGPPLNFRPETGHPKGYLLGPRDCGRNFRRFLEAVPTYVDRHSSLLGGYYLTFDSYVTGWDPDHYWSHLAPLQKKYGILHGIDSTQHFLPDIEIGLALGFGGLLDKIAKYRALNPGPEEQAYYDGLAEYVQGMQAWIRRHVAAAREMARAEAEPFYRHGLEEAAELNERLVAAAPATFLEACQWLAWYQMGKRSYIGGGSIGRIDQCLHPYYLRDREAGRLSDEEAVFHLACLLLKDSAYLQVGGMDEQGRDASNPVSFLLLEAAHRIRIPVNLAVMVHAGMDRRLLRRGVELLVSDRMGIPRFAGQDAIVNGMVRRGFPLEVARQRVQAGCHWFCLPGREYCFSDVIKINFARVLGVALDAMMAEAARAPSVARLWDLFVQHLETAAGVVAEGIDFHIEHQRRYYPELAISLLCHGPLEKGTDASHGSLEYVNIGVDGAALATVADSFAALEQRIEREQSVTWPELYGALNQNWWRHGRTRRLMRTAPGYGRGGTRGDAWALRVVRCFSETIVRRATPAGHRMTPGLFSWASTIAMGRETGATPDGRGAGEPISFGANPNPGRLHGGPLTPTALSTAVAAVQPGFGNPAPLQFDVDTGSLEPEESVAAVEALILAHFGLGGTLINANVLDRQTVLDACRDPARYPDLVVRVTGFSAYFASLSPEFRKLVHERIVALEGVSVP